MSKQPTISLELDAAALREAVSTYVTTNMFGRPVQVSDITFTAGRGPNGHTAKIDITIGNAVAEVQEEKAIPQEPVKRAKKNKVAEPEPEVETEEEVDSPLPDDENDAVDPEDVPVPSSKQNLFKS